MATNPDDSAFHGGGGMTKREYIAAQILGTIKAEWNDEDYDDRVSARRAVRRADELIRALNSYESPGD